MFLLRVGGAALIDGVTLFFVLSGSLPWRPFASAIALGGALHDAGLLQKDAPLVQELSPPTLASGIEPAWSMSVEVTFYLLLPLLGVLLRGSRRGVQRGALASVGLAPAALLTVVALVGKLAATHVIPVARVPCPAAAGAGIPAAEPARITTP